VSLRSLSQESGVGRGKRSPAEPAHRKRKGGGGRGNSRNEGGGAFPFSRWGPRKQKKKRGGEFKGKKVRGRTSAFKKGGEKVSSLPLTKRPQRRRGGRARFSPGEGGKGGGKKGALQGKKGKKKVKASLFC